LTVDVSDLRRSLIAFLAEDPAPAQVRARSFRRRASTDPINPLARMRRP